MRSRETSGAGALGRLDQNVRRDELLAHVSEITAAVDVPVNVDSEDCFADTVDGVTETASLLASTGAAGFSIEDYDPRTDSIRPVGEAAERVSPRIVTTRLGRPGPSARIVEAWSWTGEPTNAD